MTFRVSLFIQRTNGSKKEKAALKILTFEFADGKI